MGELASESSPLPLSGACTHLNPHPQSQSRKMMRSESEIPNRLYDVRLEVSDDLRVRLDSDSEKERKKSSETSATIQIKG